MLGVLLVFIGGGLGAVARHLVAVATARLAGDPAEGAFPYATLFVNAVGCLAIGFAAATLPGREAWRLLLVVGVLGGFTTYSSFGLDAVRLFLEGQPGKAVLYVLLTNVLGLLAVWLTYESGDGSGVPMLAGD